MQLSQESSDSLLISAYTDNSVSINGRNYDSPIMVTGQAIVVINKPVESLCLQDILPHSTHPVVLVASNNPLTAELFALKAELSMERIALETMTIGSACRTYNVMASEDRTPLLFIFFE